MTEPLYPPIGLLEGKVAVVTGAGRGIGKVIARLFVEQGAKVVATDFSGGQEETAAELGTSAIACHADVSREEDVEAMFARAFDTFGRVDASIHVAGNPGARWGDEVTMEEYDAFTAVHLRGTMLCCKYAVRAMQRGGGGAIVNFSAVAAFGHNNRNSTVYSAAKAGVTSLTRSFAVQYGPQNIRANAVAPGFTLSEKNLATPPEVAADMIAKSALRRAGRPEEQAAVVAFLASDRASYITGVTIPVDGGWTAQLA